MDQLISKLKIDYPNLVFEEGNLACWSPKEGRIFFRSADTIENHAALALLHEIGHAKLNHRHYSNDVDLLSKEVAAWQAASDMAPSYGISADYNHIQDCVDTYRDWIHKRSACVECGSHGLQSGPKLYTCLNCGATWAVSTSRFCRPYRQNQAAC